MASANVSLQKSCAISVWPLTLGFGDGSAALWGGLGRRVGADARGRNNCCFFAPNRLIIEDKFSFARFGSSEAQLNTKQCLLSSLERCRRRRRRRKAAKAFGRPPTRPFRRCGCSPLINRASDDPPIWDLGEAMNEWGEQQAHRCAEGHEMIKLLTPLPAFCFCGRTMEEAYTTELLYCCCCLDRSASRSAVGRNEWLHRLALSHPTQ